MNPLPSLNTIYVLLLQEENQRNNPTPSSLTSDIAAMGVRKPGGYKQFKPSPVQPNTSFTTTTPNNSTPSCTYCHQQNHTTNKCFFLHGYPPWHHLYGQPKPKRTPPKKLAASSSKAPTANLTASTKDLPSNA